MSTDFIYVICSCKKKLDISKNILNFLKKYNEKFVSYIVYGDENIDSDYIIEDENIIVLKNNDNYEEMSKKVINLFRYINNKFPNIKGLIKSNDDILPNVEHIFEIFKNSLAKNINYGGKIIINLTLLYHIKSIIVSSVSHYCYV